MQKHALKTVTVDTIFYIALSSAVLFVVNLHTISRFLTMRASGTSATAIDYPSISLPLFKFLDKFSSLTTLLFWAGLGSVSYILAIWTDKVFSSALRETKQADYVRPDTNKAKYWFNTTLNNLALLTFLAVWMASLYLFVQILLPRFSKLLNHSLNSGSLGQRAGYLAGAIALTAISIFLIEKLIQLLKWSWHRFST